MESAQSKITPGLQKSSGGGGPSSENVNLRGNRIKALAPRPNPQRTHMMRLRSCGDEETGAAAGHTDSPCPVGSQKTKSSPLLIDLTESPETAITPLALQNNGATLTHNNGDVVSDLAVAAGISQLSLVRDEIEDVDAMDTEVYACSEYICEIVRYSAELEVNSSISRGELQLVGVTAVFLAAKYEEAGTPKISTFIDLCVPSNSPNSYPITKESIRAMELKMFAQLEFDLASPPPILFFRRFSKIAKAQNFWDHDTHATARYVMELSIVDYSVVDMMPSAVAAGSLALAMMIWERKSLRAVWTQTLEHYSAYAVHDLRIHTLRMAKVLARVQEGPNPLNLNAVQREYARAGDPCYGISTKDELKVDWWKERVMNELENPLGDIPLSDPA